MPFTLTLGPITLGRLRRINARLAALEAERLDVLAIALEGAGHDPNTLEIVSLDLTDGRMVAATTESPDAA